MLDMHTVKPLDEEAVLAAAMETGVIVTAEEHNILGGLGGAVAEVVSGTHPVPVLRVGVQDVFGHSGNALELLERYGLTSKAIVEKVKMGISMK